MHKLANVTIFLVCLMAGAPLAAQAQDKPADGMQTLRAEARANKKLVVSKNLQLTQDEGNRFWPLYNSYQTDLDAINGRIAKLAQSYSADYATRSLTDDNIRTWIQEFISIQQAETDLYGNYVRQLYRTLPERKVMRFLQTENKIRAISRYDLAADVPLAP